MKFLCPGCERLVPASSFRTEGEALYLTCARCAAENPLDLHGSSAPAPAPVSSADLSVPVAPYGRATSPVSLPPPPSAATALAPRVVSLRSVTDAVKLAADAAGSGDPFGVPEDRCPKCVGARPEHAETCPHCGLAYVNFRAEETLPSKDVAEAFRATMQHWDDPERHDAVLKLATQRGELSSVGRLYRLRLVAAPLDPIAQHGRDEVVRRASAAGEAMHQNVRDDGDARTPAWQVALLVVMAIGLLVMVGVLISQISAN